MTEMDVEMARLREIAKNLPDEAAARKAAEGWVPRHLELQQRSTEKALASFTHTSKTPEEAADLKARLAEIEKRYS